MPQLTARQEHLVATVVLALILCAYFLPVLGGDQISQGHHLYTMRPWSAAAPPGFDFVSRAGEGDQAFQFRPLLHVAREQVRDGHLPLWNPYSYGGNPLLGDMQTALAYPLTWLAFLLPVDDAWTWMCLIKLLVAGLGAYFLARRFRAGLGGGLVAGSVYMLSASMIYWLQAPISNVYSLLPWLLLTSDRLYRRPGAPRAAALALTAGLVVLGGHPESSVLSVSAAAVYVGVLALLDRGRAARERAAVVAQWVGAHVLGAGLAAVAALPFLEAFQGSLTESIHGTGAQHLPAWAGLVWAMPGIFGDGRPAVYGFDTYTPIAAYAGVVTLLLAGVAAVRLRRHPATVALAAVAVVALMLAFWIPPASWIADVLPVYSKSNLFGRLNFVVALVLAVGAGVGAASLRRRALPPRAAGAALGVLLGAVTLYILIDHFTGTLWSPRSVEVDAFARFLAFAALGGICLAVLGRVRHPLVLVLPIAVVVADLAWFHGYNAVLPERDQVPPATPALKALERRPGPYRINVIRSPDSLMLPPNTFANYGLESVEGYDYPQSLRWFEFSRDVLGHVGPDVERRLARGAPSRAALTALRMMNVRYHVADPGTPLPTPGMRTLYDGGDARVFEDRHALPRAYVVPYVRHATRDQALRALADGRLDPSTEALVPRDATAPASRGGEAHLRPAHVDSPSPDERRVLVGNGEGGWLVLADAYSPHWTAEVDGRPARVRPTNFAAMGVRLASGGHVVTFRLERGSFRAGAVISALALLVIVLLWLDVPARVRRRTARR
ncbi:MAG TPA: hypothetical protein VJT75_09595 [Thermoleophilaceae bacterium]|nr:hypothetical protein [Thermoleophilaceae bacterium]